MKQAYGKKLNQQVTANRGAIVASENSQEQKKVIYNKLWIKILVPVVIVCAIIGIYFMKNQDDFQKPVQDTNIVENATEDNIEAIDDNPDFELHVTDVLDIEQLKSYGLPIMIDFGADACIPCKEMAPVLVKLNEELKGKVIVKFVDVWKYQEVSEGYPIRVIPTQVFFDKEGKPYMPSDPQAMQMQMYEHKETKEHVFTTHEGGMTEEMILAVLKDMGVAND